MTTAHYYLPSDGGQGVRALEATVDDLSQEDRCMVLYLIRAARQGPLSQTNTNIFRAQSTTLRDRVRQNVTVKIVEDMPRFHPEAGKTYKLTFPEEHEP